MTVELRAVLLQTEPVSIPGFGDPFSSISHLAGAAVFAVLGLALVARGRGRPARMVALGVFALTAVAVLAVSGTYHLLARDATARAILRRLDHAAIFVFIAGTFTAGHGILFRGILRWGMLILIWLGAGLGIALKTIFFESVPESVGLAAYLGLGWVGAFSAAILWRRFGFRFLRHLVLGALCYTGGALIEFRRWPVLVPGVVGAHELFHVAVLGGIAFHWRFVHTFADGSVPPIGGGRRTHAS